MHGAFTRSWVWARLNSPHDRCCRVGKAKRAHHGESSKQWWARRKCAFAHPREFARSGLVAHLAEQIIVVKILRDLRVEQQLLHVGIVAFLGALEQVALGGELVQMLLGRS